PRILPMLSSRSNRENRAPPHAPSTPARIAAFADSSVIDWRVVTDAMSSGTVRSGSIATSNHLRSIRFRAMYRYGYEPFRLQLLDDLPLLRDGKVIKGRGGLLWGEDLIDGHPPTATGMEETLPSTCSRG